MDTFTDTAEDFTPLTSGTAPGLELLRSAHTFQGKKLFPYSEGARILTQSIAGTNVGTDHYLMILFFILSDLQAAYERHKTDRVTEDDATDAATAEILDAFEAAPSKYRASVVRRVGKLGKKGVAEATKLALKIYDEAQKSELISAESETPGGAPGK